MPASSISRAAPPTPATPWHRADISRHPSARAMEPTPETPCTSQRPVQAIAAISSPPMTQTHGIKQACSATMAPTARPEPHLDTALHPEIRTSPGMWRSSFDSAEPFELFMLD